MTPGISAEWEREAERWVRWARTPGHDAYWHYRDEFFDAIVPPPSRRTLEIGCGEGRVARDLAERGHRVVALDTAPSLVRAARQEDPTGAYLLADGAALPLHDESVDLVVAYNSLQVVDDMPGAVREAGRVLERGGFLCICVVHPVTDLGGFVDDSPDGRFTLRGGYFDTVRVEDTVFRDGLAMTFAGWTYSLEHYTLALEREHFRIDALREPRPRGATEAFARWQEVPLFLQIRAVKS